MLLPPREFGVVVSKASPLERIRLRDGRKILLNRQSAAESAKRRQREWTSHEAQLAAADEKFRTAQNALSAANDSLKFVRRILEHQKASVRFRDLAAVWHRQVAK